MDYDILNNGQKVGEIRCNTNNTLTYSNKEVAQLFGQTYMNSNWHSEHAGLCTGGSINSKVVASAGGQNYSYGIMTGASKGNALAYQITVPGDISKVWNSGNGNYVATGNGSIQEIDINAKIVPSESTSLYLAQDSYFDTVTAVISY